MGNVLPFSLFQVADSEGGVTVSDPPKQPPKRRRILAASSITTVPVYSNKVSRSRLLDFKHLPD